MISQTTPTTTYKAAQAVARAVEAHFARHFGKAARKVESSELAPVPPPQVIEAMIDVAFWASLRREEGNSPKISLAYLPAEQSKNPLLFEHKLALTPAILTKLAPAVEHPGIHLGLYAEGDELCIWGATSEVPGNCFILEVVEPGLLVIKHRRTEGFGKFVNVAILKGDQIKVVDERTAGLPDCPAILTSMLGFTAPSTWNNSMNVLVQLAVAMRAHGRGGSLLVVPSQQDIWRDSILHIGYPVQPSFSGLSELMRSDAGERKQSWWMGALNLAVDRIAGLTAVDGATIINDQYELIGFGAKTGRSFNSERVSQIIVTEPIVDNVPMVVHPTQTGGTRHLSAAQFVYDQRDSIALVASQDGRFTIFAWSPCEEMVHAHRVDSLLI
ncbi:putative sensor domain DACNV-containing protein [Arsenicibacter rosenii]|uniref:Probable sensor domain-containing protein n=1 Tax=Arsenicibacter rosenii TaxID=1750698 RepID=A0A1S2VS55_9BACT|nr:hypothetical protein [Arsenicibacter rosenii]OIN60758.1 hypothetical protein BLX24_01250 [Arsenicibacter rosenii]